MKIHLDIDILSGKCDCLRIKAVSGILKNVWQYFSIAIQKNVKSLKW